MHEQDNYQGNNKQCCTEYTFKITQYTQQMPRKQNINKYLTSFNPKKHFWTKTD